MVSIMTHILFATDFSPSSAPAFQYAVEWADTVEAKLTMLHVLSHQPGLDIDVGIAQSYLDEQQNVAQDRELARQSLCSPLPQMNTKCVNLMSAFDPKRT